jgi:hypothetical protein
MAEQSILPWRVVMDQRVPGAGRAGMRGLVAARNINENETITQFHVEQIFADKEAAQDADKYYVVQIAENKYARLSNIDGRVNLAAHYDNKVGNLSNHQARTKANAKMVAHAPTCSISLKSKKVIKQGEPIFYDYGNHEWTKAFRTTKRTNRRKHPNLRQGTLPPRKRKKNN